jgi:integrase
MDNLEDKLSGLDEAGIAKLGDNLRVFAKEIKQSIPELESLPKELLNEIAQRVVLNRLLNKFDYLVDTVSIDHKAEVVDFLSKYRSVPSRKTYYTGLLKLVEYSNAIKVKLLDFTLDDADNYVRWLVARNYSPAYVDTLIAAASSYCEHLVRKHFSAPSRSSRPAFINPFRGVKGKPTKDPVRETVVPDEDEVKIIMDEAGYKLRLALALMAKSGLRVGALPSFTVNGLNFTCLSKGTIHSGILDKDVLKYFSGLRSRMPFREENPNKIKHRVRILTALLHKKGLIKAVYSCHDFRHYFAIQEYSKDKDIYRVSKLLGHRSIVITEAYLKGLKALPQNDGIQ